MRSYDRVARYRRYMNSIIAAVVVISVPSGWRNWYWAWKPVESYMWLEWKVTRKKLPSEVTVLWGRLLVVPQ